jgi:aromatic ring-cleaving dioxygenase
VAPDELAEIKARLAAETHHLADFAADGMADGATCWSREYVEDVGALVAEVERLQLANADAFRTLTGLEPFFEELEKIAPDERALRVVEHTRKAFGQAIDWLLNAHAARLP